MSLSPFAGGSRQTGSLLFIESALVRFSRHVQSSPFLRSLRLSLITIHALLLREAVTRYGRRSAGYIWALIDPLIQMGVMMAVFSYAGRKPAVGDSVTVFFITGIMPLMLFRGAVTRGAKAIISNKALMNYPQVRGFEVITARMALEILTSIAVVWSVILFMKTFHGLPITAWISDPLELLAALSTLVLLSYGACFLSAQIGRMFAQWGDLMSALARLLFFTSGVWYTLDTLPPGLRDLVAYNPLAQEIEWIRDAAIPGFESNHVDPTYPVAFGLVCLFLGLFIEWIFRLGRFDLDRNRL